MAKEIRFSIVWTEPSICDLERIDRYLRRRNPAAAEKTGEGLLKRVLVLETQPEIGRLYDSDLPWRVLVHRSYKIFYRVLRGERVVEIAHVRHAARDNPTLDDLFTE